MVSHSRIEQERQQELNEEKEHIRELNKQFPQYRAKDYAVEKHWEETQRGEHADPLFDFDWSRQEPPEVPEEEPEF